MKTINSIKFFALLAIILFTGSILQSCKPSTPAPTQADLEGYWVLKSINGKEAKTIFAGAQPTLQFNFSDSIVSGTGGCNQYNGVFSYKDGKFLVPAPSLAVTQMLCTEDNDEGQFLLELTNVNNTLSIVDGVLKISHDDKVVLEFDKGEAPAETLSLALDVQKLGGEWKLKTIDGIDATTKYTEIPTINLNLADNTVSGNAGCNGYNATFSLSNDQLILGPIMSTRMACPNLEGEAQFTQAIADTSIITMPSDDVLQFAKKGVVLLEFTKTTVAPDSTTVTP